MSKECIVGSYYFPNYHVDPRNEKVHGHGWSEWELVKSATPRFDGHFQPKVPLWGYLDEADPLVMEKKIDTCADYGIDYWIFDWYWYDDGPFLERCLEKGYMGAKNNERVKFCCMWANHEWQNIHPMKMRDMHETLYHGKVSQKTYETLTDYVVEKYFKHPSHFMIDDCPYFSIYELGTLVENFGSVDATRIALDRFRAKTKASGFKDLHLNAVVWGRPILPGESTPSDPVQLLKDLGFDSVTSYVWIHHVHLSQSPITDYEYVRDKYFDYWDEVETKFSIPYYPNVTMGWDSSPRTIQSDMWDPSVGYPFTNLMGNNTPNAFKKALEMTKARLDLRKTNKIFNINCWNEWTEGSYLEPDTVNGMAYLKAVKKVMSDEC
ncbi:MAG: hypothetical protein QG588_1904 [Candidatus Poribacteria bacterium]|nr:hypothetical protein [Candidatus Poribacteria bacterium]